MIPFRYRLRPGTRVETIGEGDWRVVSVAPLAALRVNGAAARLLEQAHGGASLVDLAAALSLSEERCLAICEGFRRRGILELEAESDHSASCPAVTVVVPTRDRAGRLSECLAAFGRLDYPADRLEIIVVDDGSADPAVVAAVAGEHGARLVATRRNLGPAAARNLGVAAAGGELLAFVDSDCVADAGWLRALTPYFAWDRTGAVAGRTTGYFATSRLARYEEVASPLDMGARPMIAGEGDDGFYAPTCNLLVRRSVYQGLGGLRGELRLGEDVDFCWRLRERGLVLVYAPEGVVRHKHPERLPAMLWRRAEYGSSEARLYQLHPTRRGRLRLPPAAAATVGLVSAGLLLRRPWVLAAALAPPALDAARRARRLRRAGVEVPAAQVLSSALRGHLSALYFAYFRLVRYHLGELAAAGALVPGARLLAAAAILCAAGVDFTTRRPRLTFPEYLFLYVAEHAAYQMGVHFGRLASWRRLYSAAAGGRGQESQDVASPSASEAARPGRVSASRVTAPAMRVSGQPAHRRGRFRLRGAGSYVQR